MKKYKGAVADYSQPIKLKPALADAYNNRGVLRQEVKNYPGAIADLQKAAQLYRQPNKIEDYKTVR